MNASAFEFLPLKEFGGTICEEIGRRKNLLLTAPTGSGKSTFIPWLLASQKKGLGKVAVLEPRRLAATSLANYLSKLSETRPGTAIGYRIRFESAVSDDTKILFTTYGNFLQTLLHESESFDWIVFDEFHERRTEMDLLLAYFLARQKEPNAPRIAVLSAELSREKLEKYLGIKCLQVGRPGFPVQILNQESLPGSQLSRNVEKALRTLERNGVWKTTLAFLPGKGEIASVHRHLEEAFGYGKLRILDLYGGQDKTIEQDIFLHTNEPRVILSTNIAETSLTIPDVTGVIDSGLERTSEFNVSQGKNILKLGRISMQNAVQRTGRAGRTRQGVCIRLWSKREESLFSQSIVPEIQKSDLRPVLLKRAALAKKLGIAANDLKLPTEPDPTLAEKAGKELSRYGFLSTDGKISPSGLRALEIPLNDLQLAKAYLEAESLSPLTLAVFSILDSDEPARGKAPLNALECAQSMLQDKRSATRETQLSYRRLQEFTRAKNSTNFQPDNPRETLRLFWKSFPDSLAIKSGNAYRTKNDTFPIEPETVEESDAILVFHLLRTSSSQKSEMRAGFYLTVPSDFLKNERKEVRYELLWRAGQERYIGLEISSANGTEISRREIQPQEVPDEVQDKLKALTGKTWMERHRREDLSHLWMDDANKILLCKMKLAAESFPEYSLPTWNAEDLELVTEDFLDGHFLLRELTPELFRSKMKEFFGENMIPWLGKMFPDTLALPNGKKARYRYAENSPVELSARIEDLMAFRGEHFIADGKVKVRYDILAPNFRTAQKTWDLTGFWKNTYPQIRKELRGRYPKHPWPESVV